MEIIKWILLGAIVVTLGLLIIAYIKNIKIMKKICECLVMPFSGTLISLLISNYLPDSLHLLKITITALSLISISTVFISFENITALRISGRFLSIFGIFTWALLYREVFYIYNVPAWLTIIAICIYAAATVTSCILSGKQEPLFFAAFAVSFAFAAYLHFCSLIFLIYSHTASSIMLFGGTTLLAALIVFHFINHDKKKIKHAGIIRYILMAAAHILIACSNVLMIR